MQPTIVSPANGHLVPQSAPHQQQHHQQVVQERVSLSKHATSNVLEKGAGGRCINQELEYNGLAAQPAGMFKQKKEKHWLFHGADEGGEHNPMINRAYPSRGESVGTGTEQKQSSLDGHGLRRQGPAASRVTEVGDILGLGNSSEPLQGRKRPSSAGSVRRFG